MTRRRAASMAARSRSSPTPSAWARAASCAVGAGRCCRRFSFAAGPSDPCPEEALADSSRGSRRRGARLFAGGRRRRQAPEDETEALDRVAGRDLVHPAQDLRAEVRQLVGPDRRRALDGELAPAEGLGARAARHRVADGARPRGVRARLLAGSQPVQRRSEDFSQPARQVAARGLRSPRPRPALAGALVLLVRRAAHSASRSGGAGGASSSGGAASPAAREPASGSWTTMASASSSSVK